MTTFYKVKKTLFHHHGLVSFCINYHGNNVQVDRISEHSYIVRKFGIFLVPKWDNGILIGFTDN